MCNRVFMTSFGGYSTTLNGMSESSYQISSEVTYGNYILHKKLDSIIPNSAEIKLTWEIVVNHFYSTLKKQPQKTRNISCRMSDMKFRKQFLKNFQEILHGILYEISIEMSLKIFSVWFRTPKSNPKRPVTFCVKFYMKFCKQFLKTFQEILRELLYEISIEMLLKTFSVWCHTEFYIKFHMNEWAFVSVLISCIVKPLGQLHGYSLSQLSFNNIYNYSDVILDTMASQITSLTIVYSTVYSSADQRKHQSSASLAIVRGIHRWPVNSAHKNVSIWWRHHAMPGCQSRNINVTSILIWWLSARLQYLHCWRTGDIAALH